MFTIKVTNLASSILIQPTTYARLHHRHCATLVEFWETGKQCEPHADHILAPVFALNDKIFCLWLRLYVFFHYLWCDNRLVFHFVCICPKPTETNRIYNMHMKYLEVKCMLKMYFTLSLNKRAWYINTVLRQIYNKVM